MYWHQIETRTLPRPYLTRQHQGKPDSKAMAATIAVAEVNWESALIEIGDPVWTRAGDVISQ